jgi:hypothetical protein
MTVLNARTAIHDDLETMTVFRRRTTQGFTDSFLAG